jgi:hypothetical protein
MLCYNSKHKQENLFQRLMSFCYRKLVVPGDLRSYGGGNGLPRNVKQSPNFSQIVEEDEEEEEEEEENDEKKNDVSILLVRSLL